ncbi:hypothetical protein CFC21_050964 [Triticum aestivum]|uniref:Amino acid transporter transmembrane domain-containing protein n=2 Tax=Triticum aestivum TaxID=4565 RepID=A0A9R1G5J7_WHEAT|nr:hypothetical protein CFC21_050964 [Triticum aestivum]
MEEHKTTGLAATASPLGEPLLTATGKRVVDRDAEAQLPPYPSAGASFSRTCLNLTNAVSGIGVLSMPYAVSRGGWLSLALFALVGTVCYYTGTLIARCMLADGSVATYPDVGQLAFGAAGRRTVALFMYVELYLVAISFLVLEGDNLDKLFPPATGCAVSSCTSSWPAPSCCPPPGSRTSACSPTCRPSGSSRRRP